MKRASLIIAIALSLSVIANAQISIQDFNAPARTHYPETWFHYVDGNVDRDGITKDLEAIAGAGISGVQFFHGGWGNEPWKGVTDPVYCLSDRWESLVRHTASEANRLGLRFTMQNCPGWAMSGGPWIDLDDTMRHLAYSRTAVKEGTGRVVLPLPENAEDRESDFRDICVLAFPTPAGEFDKPLWEGSLKLAPSSPNHNVILEMKLDSPAVARTLEFCAVREMNYAQCDDPDMRFTVEAIDASGATHTVLSTEVPRSNWQDTWITTTFALSECGPCSRYRITFDNRYDMNLSRICLRSAARYPNWEGEAGWTLRGVYRSDAVQDRKSYVDRSRIVDITSCMKADGTLEWDVPEGEWTVLRIGHVNTKRKNAPAPAEATGWECNKLDPSGADIHFKNYVGKLASGPLDGLLSNMLMDSWECEAQTWTASMPAEFARVAGYELKTFLPAIFGYVLDDIENTALFLGDWRRTLNDLYVNNFFGRMAANAHEAGLTVSYETAGGDVTPMDPMEYYKFADVPMCEFWQNFSGYLSSHEFKPIRPTASAARMYGKKRVDAESFTSFQLTWDEHWQMLRDIANQNIIDGVTHNVFHTYTHNPKASEFFPGVAFNGGIGTPFLRGQTWWKYMPSFTSYLARCSYMLESGRMVSDVLFYIGDETQQKPLQRYPFPDGYRYDYCNPDALLNRISVKDGRWVTPEGVSYSLMWIPEPGRMLPETLEKLVKLVGEGGILVADAPAGIATLRKDSQQQARYDKAVSTLWQGTGIRNVRKGKVVSGYGIEQALQACGISPDVNGLQKQWLHRQDAGTDWYFVCAPAQTTFNGEVKFHCTGPVQIWDPVTGESLSVPSRAENGYTAVNLDLAEAQSLFVVFNSPSRADRVQKPAKGKSIDISGNSWTVSFPAGWGIEAPVVTDRLIPWKDMPLPAEGKAFSGTATYTTVLNLPKVEKGAQYVLNLGSVDMIACVRINGREFSPLWTEPYSVDISSALKKGENTVEIDVTSSWYNRLVYDFTLPEAERKTWTLEGFERDDELKSYGLFGPVTIAW